MICPAATAVGPVSAACSCSSKHIARDLGISPRTVEAHRRNVLHKLEVGSAYVRSLGSQPNTVFSRFTLTLFCLRKMLVADKAVPQSHQHRRLSAYCFWCQAV